MIALYILLIILFLFMLISLIPIRCVFIANTTGAKINIKYLFFKYTLYPAPKKEPKPKQVREIKKEKKSIDIKKQIAILKDAKDDILNISGQALDYIGHHAITIENLNISAKIGTGDPADTGIICGAAYSVIYQFIGALSSVTKLKEQCVTLDADFDNTVFSAGIYVQLRTRLAHLLVLAVMLVKLLIKYKYAQFHYERSL